jgi:LysM repeat protein
MLEASQLVYRTRFSPAEVKLSQDRVRFRVRQAINRRGRRTRPLVFRLAPLAASLVLIGTLVAGITSILAESSLPGDPLYSMKRLTENIRLTLVSDRDTLETQFDKRRIHEIEQLISQQREARVMFEGEIEAINDTGWLVAGLSVHVPPETIVQTPLEVGSRIEVSATTTHDGQIIAISIYRIDDVDAPILPAITPTNVPSQIPPTPSVTASASNPPTPTAILTPTATLTPMTRPNPHPATSCTPTQPLGWVVYSVQPNDTLSGIAASTGIVLERLMRVNCLTDRNLIITGQRLYVPVLPIFTEAPELRSTLTEERRAGDDNSGPGSNNSGSANGERGDDSGPGRDEGNGGEGGSRNG